MRFFHLIIILILALSATAADAQVYTVSGKISTATGADVEGVTICLKSKGQCATADAQGNYLIAGVRPGKYTIIADGASFETVEKEIVVGRKNLVEHIQLQLRIKLLDSVNIRSYRQTFGMTRLKDVDGAGIYAGKKSEVIVLKDLVANTATNNARQVYSKVAGLNIWENDGGAGIQLAIGGRGLNPNRTSNFNTRQNGYDISADALGYPESYYTPPVEAMERIEIVRGASSLQYGTQFGGIINFKLNSGPDSQKLQLIARETAGSWGFSNTSASVGGTVGKLNYYVFYQHKLGNGWRNYSAFNTNTLYSAATYSFSHKLSVSVQFTHMNYLEQQPGGLSDQMFLEDPHQSSKTRNWFKVNWNLGAVLLDYAITPNLKFNSRFFGLVAERSALGIINTVADPGGARQYRTDDYTNWGNESRMVYTYHIKESQPFTLLAGIRYYHGYTDRQIGDGNDGSGGAKSDFAFSKTSLIDSLAYSRYKFPNHNTSLFAENIFKVGEQLSIIPGLRYEHIVTNATGFYNQYVQDRSQAVIYSQLIDESRSSNRSFVIGGIGLSYNQSTSCQLYANISQNYRSINFNDMSITNPNYRVDPNLQDEKGYSADIGARGHYNDLLYYDLSLFAINYANRIGLVLQKDTSSPNTYQYTTNVAQSRNYGLESYTELDFWKLIFGHETKTKFSVFSNFSWISARYVNSKVSAYENKRVEFVPDVIFKGGLTFKRNKFSATWQYAYTGQQFSDATNAVNPSNNGINGLVPSYWVMDLSADYRISKIFAVSASLNNLTNNMYFTRRADSYPGPGIIPADGRAVYVTFQVKI